MERSPDVRTDMSKVKTLDKLGELTRSLKQKGKTIVHCHGVFDQLHPGHIRHLEAAKHEGDVLVVTVTPDRFVNKGLGRPVFNEALRAESIAALECVDYVAVNEWPTAVEAIMKLKPHVYVKGSDYIHRENDPTGGIYKEEEAVKSIGGRIHFTNELSFSSTELFNHNFSVYPKQAQEFLEEFRSRYSANNIIQRLKELKKMKVLVIGDAIIDEYHYCEPMGKSPKESIITTKYRHEEAFAGGAIAAANHIAGFCEDVHLITLLGAENSREEFIRSHLRPNVRAKFFYREDAPTPTKRRYIDPFLAKMFAVYHLNNSDLSPYYESEICKYIVANVQKYDVVLVADFGHGFIGPQIIELVCKKAPFLAVTAQTNSANVGFNLITKYPRADYICLDSLELRLACHDKFGELKALVPKIGLDYDNVAITRGNEGSLTYSSRDGFFEIPALTDRAVDRLGAGDAYLAVTTPCVASGYPMELAGFIGNAVGALQVQIIGNKEPVEPAALFKFIKALLK